MVGFVMEIELKAAPLECWPSRPGMYWSRSLWIVRAEPERMAEFMPHDEGLPQLVMFITAQTLSTTGELLTVLGSNMHVVHSTRGQELHVATACHSSIAASIGCDFRRHVSHQLICTMPPSPVRGRGPQISGRGGERGSAFGARECPPHHFIFRRIVSFCGAGWSPLTRGAVATNITRLAARATAGTWHLNFWLSYRDPQVQECRDDLLE